MRGPLVRILVCPTIPAFSGRRERERSGRRVCPTAAPSWAAIQRSLRSRGKEFAREVARELTSEGGDVCLQLEERRTLKIALESERVPTPKEQPLDVGMRGAL